MSSSPIYVSDADSDMPFVVDVSSDESSPPASPLHHLRASERILDLGLPRTVQPRIDHAFRNYAALRDHYAEALEQRARDASYAVSSATNPYFATLVAESGGFVEGGVMYPDVARVLGFMMPQHLTGGETPVRKRKYACISTSSTN